MAGRAARGRGVRRHRAPARRGSGRSASLPEPLDRRPRGAHRRRAPAARGARARSRSSTSPTSSSSSSACSTGRVRLLLSDVTAAVDWDLAAQVVDHLGLEVPARRASWTRSGRPATWASSTTWGSTRWSWRRSCPTSTRTPTRCSARWPGGWGSPSAYERVVDALVELIRLDRPTTDPPEPTVSYFAAALARTEQGWTGVELDLDEVEDLEALADLLRDLTGDGPGPALLLLEEDDEHLAIVRVDGGAGSLAEPRVFLSDRRAVAGQRRRRDALGGAPRPDERRGRRRRGHPRRSPSRSATPRCSPTSARRAGRCSTCAPRRACCPPTC